MTGAELKGKKRPRKEIYTEYSGAKGTLIPNVPGFAIPDIPVYCGLEYEPTQDTQNTPLGSARYSCP